MPDDQHSGCEGCPWAPASAPCVFAISDAMARKKGFPAGTKLVCAWGHLTLTCSLGSRRAVVERPPAAPPRPPVRRRRLNVLLPLAILTLMS